MPIGVHACQSKRACVPLWLPCHAGAPLQVGKEVLGAVLLAFNVGVCAYFIWCYISEYVIGFIWTIDDGADDKTADGKLEWKDIHGFAAKKFHGSRFLPRIQSTLLSLERCSRCARACQARTCTSCAQGAAFCFGCDVALFLPHRVCMGR